MKITIALALLVLALPANAVDGTTAMRKAFVLNHPCPVTGKQLLTCSGWQVVWDRYPCAVNAGLMWMKTTAAKAKARSAELAAVCTRSKPAYDACMANPVLEIMDCSSTSHACAPRRILRECFALLK